MMVLKFPAINLSCSAENAMAQPTMTGKRVLTAGATVHWTHAAVRSQSLPATSVIIRMHRTFLG